MADLFHIVGGDLSISQNGDLAIAQGSEETQQRVLRRLCTNPGDYIQHLGYGAGLPQQVGQPLNIGQIQAIVKEQIGYEKAVLQSPPPAISVSGGFNLISIDLKYVDAVSGQAVPLSFDVSGGP